MTSNIKRFTQITGDAPPELRTLIEGNKEALRKFETQEPKRIFVALEDVDEFLEKNEKKVNIRFIT